MHCFLTDESLKKMHENSRPKDLEPDLFSIVEDSQPITNSPTFLLNRFPPRSDSKEKMAEYVKKMNKKDAEQHLSLFKEIINNALRILQVWDKKRPHLWGRFVR